MDEAIAAKTTENREFPFFQFLSLFTMIQGVKQKFVANKCLDTCSKWSGGEEITEKKDNSLPVQFIAVIILLNNKLKALTFFN